MASNEKIVINCNLANPRIKDEWPQAPTCFSARKGEASLRHSDWSLQKGLCRCGVCYERSDLVKKPNESGQ